MKKRARGRTEGGIGGEVEEDEGSKEERVGEVARGRDKTSIQTQNEEKERRQVVNQWA